MKRETIPIAGATSEADNVVIRTMSAFVERTAVDNRDRSNAHRAMMPNNMLFTSPAQVKATGTPVVREDEAAGAVNHQDPACNSCHLSMGDVRTGKSFLTIADKNVCEDCLGKMLGKMRVRAVGLREIVCLMEYVAPAKLSR